MGCFLLCWLPFFILAILRPFPFGQGYVGDLIPHWLDLLLLWLGYFNSTLNPMIYARYNREFRRPFLEILCFRCRGINEKLRDEDRRRMYMDVSSVHHSSFFNQRNSTSTNNPTTLLNSYTPNTRTNTNNLNREVLNEEDTPPPLPPTHPTRPIESDETKKEDEKLAGRGLEERKRIIEMERSRFFFGTEKPPYQVGIESFGS